MMVAGPPMILALVVIATTTTLPAHGQPAPPTAEVPNIREPASSPALPSPSPAARVSPTVEPEAPQEDEDEPPSHQRDTTVPPALGPPAKNGLPERVAVPGINVGDEVPRPSSPVGKGFRQPSVARLQELQAQFEDDPEVQEWLETHADEVRGSTSVRDLFTPFQVFPGKPISAGGFSNRPCSGPYCGPRAPDHFAERITYDAAAHPEVLRLSYRSQDADWTRGCSAVVIGRAFALSALHCFGKNSAVLHHRFNFEASAMAGWSDGAPTGALDFALQDADGTPRAVTRLFIPYALDAPPDYRDVPRVDLALFAFAPRLDEPPSVEALAHDGVAIGTAITFSGYGLANVHREEWQAYAAFNAIHDLLTIDNEPYIAWRVGLRGFRGGPCKYDSGGPVYYGFERGFDDDLDTVIGVVSHLKAGREPDIADDCLNRIGRVVDLSPHVTAICQLTRSEPLACR